ncbi:hypothetical protein HNQ69_000381 [Bartonella callosciuri]|uniref:Uncharacterized protein n=1 Tax=Bartonella callosciuri TaxID=686223 RepID=A0A840NYW9_9HYPH|nr:hypothetical protein [Bartonella callosciuri]
MLIIFFTFDSSESGNYENTQKTKEKCATMLKKYKQT